MKRVLSFLLIVFLLIPCFVDAKEVTFDAKIYGDGYWEDLVSIIELQDEYFAIGNFFDTEIDGVEPKGLTDIRLFKYGEDSLNIKSQFVYGGSGNDAVTDMVQCGNDELVFVGYTNSTDIEGLSNNGSSDALIVKMNTKGEIIWQNNYGGRSFDGFYSVVAVDDGYVAVGNVWANHYDNFGNTGAKEAVIVKYDKDGNLLWEKNWGGSDYDEFTFVSTTKDGGFVTLGSSTSTDIDGIVFDELKDRSTIILVKYDKTGNVIWQKNYKYVHETEFNSVIELSDGSLIVGGCSSFDYVDNVDKEGYDDALLLKLDKDGNALWQKSYGAAYGGCFNTVKKSFDGNLLAVGYLWSDGEDGYSTRIGQEALIIKYDLMGNILDEHILGGEYNDVFFDAVETGNGYLAVGNSDSTDIPSASFDGGYPSALIMNVKITYDLKKKNEEIKNGTYEIKQVGRRAEISLSPEVGYELDTIVVEDINGKQLSYYEENGKYYVDLVDDIVVDVKYKQKSIINPNTTGLFMILEVLGLVSILGYSIFKFMKKKQTV